MATATITRSISVTLTLSEYEAKLVRGLVQNCLGDIVTEPPAERKARTAIFDAITMALTKPDRES